MRIVDHISEMTTFDLHIVKSNRWVAMYQVVDTDGEIIGYDVTILNKQRSPVCLPYTLTEAERCYSMLTGKLEMKYRGFSLN